MDIITYQPALRQALPNIYGPLEYREERAMYERIDHILNISGIEQEFVRLSLAEHGIDPAAASAKRLERFANYSVLALRANIGRDLTGMAHREFCARLADSPLLQWFLQVGQLDAIKVFAKSTSDRFTRWVSEPGLRRINESLTSLLAATAPPAGLPGLSPAVCFGLFAPILCDEVFFDSTCLRADIHFPVATDLTEGRARVIMERIEGVLAQLPAAIKQAHERLIGERKVANEDKILSLYDDSVNVIVRGKAGAEVEFGNKLWLGETGEGLIVAYKLYEDAPGDSALVKPAVQRLVVEQGFAIKHAWGDRGLASKSNKKMLESLGIRDGLCPRGVAELAKRPDEEPGFRAGLKRRAGTEARIGIFKNVFMGRPSPAKGFAHRELAVGWVVLTHNLWVVARLAEAEKRRQARAA